VHPFADLSAYLDGALPDERRAEVGRHLAGCEICSARLAELRGTARLIAGLPDVRPSRSLVPRVSVPVWMAPLRTLSAIASGAAVLAFAASTLLASASLTSTGSGAPAVAAPAAAPQASLDRARGAGGAAASTAAPGPAGPQDASSPSAQFSAASPAPAPSGNRSVAESDREKRLDTSTTAPPAVAEKGPTGPEAVALSVPARPQLGPSPWLWLLVAVAFAVLAFVLQRRLRTS